MSSISVVVMPLFLLVVSLVVLVLLSKVTQLVIQQVHSMYISRFTMKRDVQ